MDVDWTPRWQVAADIAATQHGRVAKAQLLDVGLGRGAVEKAVRSGRLHRVHDGVFALGHLAPSMSGDHTAAVLRCGPQAALGEWSAVAQLGLRAQTVRPIVVVSPTGRGRGVRGLRVIRATLTGADRVTAGGVATTSVARVLSDLSHCVSELSLRQLIREAQFRGDFDLEATVLANERRPSRLLGDVLDDLVPTESPVEDLFRERIFKRFPQIPAPDVQSRLPGACADFRWARARLVVEVDGGHHANALTYQTDIVRDNALVLSGELVLRYAKPDLTRRARLTAGQIITALRERGGYDIPWMS